MTEETDFVKIRVSINRGDVYHRVSEFSDKR